MFKYTNRPDQIPKISVNPEYSHYLDYFWDIRSLCGDPDMPIQPSLIRDWESHTYHVLHKYERDFIFKIDRAFRQARWKVLEFHSKRKAVDLGDKDKGRMSSGRHSRSRV